MKNKCVLLFLLVILMLLGTVTAHAEYFAASLPSNESVFSVCRLDGGNIVVLTDKNVYQISLASGETVKLGPRVDSSLDVFCSEDSGIYTYATDGDILYRLNTVTGSWSREAILPLNELDSDAMLASQVICLGRRIYLSLYREDKPDLLASYDLETGIAAIHGEISIRNGSSNFFVQGDNIMNLDYEDGRERQYFLFSYDPNRDQITKTPVYPNVPVGNNPVYDNDTDMYWVNVWSAQPRGYMLYSGPSLDQLTKVAGPHLSSRLIAFGGDCIIISSEGLMSYQVQQNATGKLTLANFHTRYDTRYTVERGVNISTVGINLSDILTMKNDQIDVIGLTTDDVTNLKLLKDKGYYVDLSSSPVLSRQASRLYPALSQALWTDDGKLAAWIYDAEPLMFEADAQLLSQYSLNTPTTMPELLDQMNLLVNEGVFDGGEYVPFGIVEYSQKSLIAYALQRYIFEQEVQGLRLSFDNDELRMLLSRILNEVPKEAAYRSKTGEESHVYELYIVSSSISKNQSLPLRIGPGSPAAIQTHTQVAIVNPYSKHKAEALAYLEYIASQTGTDDYILYRDMTEPLARDSVQEKLNGIDSRIAALSAQDDADSRYQLEMLKAERSMLENDLYLIDREDIAVWQTYASAMLVQQETLYIDELNMLIDRLVDGNMSLDAFISECNRYVNMVYGEAGR